MEWNCSLAIGPIGGSGGGTERGGELMGALVEADARPGEPAMLGAETRGAAGAGDAAAA